MNESASELKRLAGLWLDLTVKTWSPGDGKTRYKFFPIPVNGTPVDYYQSGHVAEALGLKEAWATLKGLLAGYRLAGSRHDNLWVSRERFENLLEEKEGLERSYKDLMAEDHYCHKCGTSN